MANSPQNKKKKKKRNKFMTVLNKKNSNIRNAKEKLLKDTRLISAKSRLTKNLFGIGKKLASGKSGQDI